MKVIDLREGLHLHHQMLSRWGGKPSELADLLKFLDVLAKFDELTVSALCSAFLEKQDNLKPKEKETRPKSIPASELVADYVRRLSAAENRSTMLSAIEELKSDKKIKIDEVNTIIDAMIGSGISYKKKPDAITAFVNWANRKFDTERRIQGSSGLF